MRPMFASLLGAVVFAAMALGIVWRRRALQQHAIAAQRLQPFRGLKVLGAFVNDPGYQSYLMAGALICALLSLLMFGFFVAHVVQAIREP